MPTLIKIAGRCGARCRDFVFPALCIVCDRPRSPDERWLCEPCRAALLENNRLRQACPRCGQNKKTA
ncbi:MAG: double zinc ribbon domain-containing protein, partial [Chitinivibrionales bacterium]|nr:double zinc ribbon domain-containing protein [Chitinivibrionales bacterium]